MAAGAEPKRRCGQRGNGWGWTDAKWKKFVATYRREMRAPAAAHLLQALAALSHHTNFSVGCYCEDESRCHRSVLRELLAAEGADL